MALIANIFVRESLIIIDAMTVVLLGHSNINRSFVLDVKTTVYHVQGMLGIAQNARTLSIW